LFKVKHTKTIHEAFDKSPDCLTPLVPVPQAILQAKNMNRIANKKDSHYHCGRGVIEEILFSKIFLFFNFSASTNPKGELDVCELEKVMRNERTSTAYVTCLACINESEALNYLNNWVRTTVHVNVVDDYRSELA
jgi:hypothetical protein